MRCTKSTASRRSRSRLARCSAASSGAEWSPSARAEPLIRRLTARPGGPCSSSAAALRCSSTKRWILVRGSGGTRHQWRPPARARDPVGAAARPDHTGQLDLAAVDRRTRERAHDGGGVLRVDEQPHPGEHVANLRPLRNTRLLLPARRALGRGGRDSWARHVPRIRGGTPAPGYALWGGPDRLERGAAGGRLIAGSPPDGGVRAASVEPLAYDFARRVSAYSGTGAGETACDRGGRPAGVDRRQPDDDATAAGDAH